MGRILVKGLKNLLLISIPAGIASLLLVELALRFVIPASNPPDSYFDTDDNVLRFDVSGPNQGYTTVGALAQHRTRWQINNTGWNSAVDYAMGPRDNPLIAIIGDSMIQGLNVDVEESIAHRLRQDLDGRYDVYSIAKGGGALSQFLHLSRYAGRNFEPNVLVFSVENRNFDQSLCDVSHPVGMMCLHDDGTDIRESAFLPYEPSPVRRWARKSAIIRYIVFNLDLSPTARPDDRTALDQQTGAAGGGHDLLLMERVERSTDYILGKIAQENPDKMVVFMADQPRRRIYQDKLPPDDGFESWTQSLLERKAQEYGFAYLDLTRAFARSYQEDGIKLESPDGFHWNGHGHSVAAQALLETLTGIESVRRSREY